MSDKEKIREHIRKNYANVALKGSDSSCCGSGCSCGDKAVDINEISAIIGYSENELRDVPQDANMGLGCGNPIAIAGLKKGETVLDLGSGGGLDCFLARNKVGEEGYIIGVDMTPEMITLARENAKESGYSNMEFRLGEIEHLPIADTYVDVIISNCVINLSLDKQQVFKEAFRVLKSGGRLSISDVVATAELPKDIKQDLAMIAGCIGGAEYVEDLREMLKSVGFTNIKMRAKDNSREIVKSWVSGKKIEDFVASFIIEATKAESKEKETKTSCCSSPKSRQKCC